MRRFAAPALLLSAMVLGTLTADDWPGFRGNKGGYADDKDLPGKLTADNVLWKVKLPGPGASSPITWGGKVFVTCYTGYGGTITKGFGGGFGKGGGGKGGFGKGGFGKDAGGDQQKLKLVILCLDRKNGDTLWQKEIAPKLPEAPFVKFLSDHGYASSTPATDGERVYAFFGKTGVFAFDIKDGKQLWQADVGKRTDKWGSASSPALTKDLLIVNAAIESGAMIALDRKTGKEKWRAKGLGTSWTSPVVVDLADGKQEVVLNLPGKIAGYDAETGEELWHCKGIGTQGNGYSITTPVARAGIVYVIGGGPMIQATALAIRAGGRGDVTDSHVVWRARAGTNIASPVLTGDHLVWVSGSAVSLKAKDGKTAFNERLYSGSEYVSAVAAGDKVFALTRFDGLYVLAGGGSFEKLGHYEFEGDTSIFNASPAISDGRLFVRSNAYLYCFGKK